VDFCCAQLTRPLASCRYQRNQHADGHSSAVRVAVSLYHAFVDISLKRAVGLPVSENGRASIRRGALIIINNLLHHPLAQLRTFRSRNGQTLPT